MKGNYEGQIHYPKEGFAVALKKRRVALDGTRFPHASARLALVEFRMAHASDHNRSTCVRGMGVGIESADHQEGDKSILSQERIITAVRAIWLTAKVRRVAGRFQKERPNFLC